MTRTVWLALIFLISLGLLFPLRTNILLRTNIGARPIARDQPAVQRLSPAPPPEDMPRDDAPPLAKSDRLPSAYFDTIPPKSIPTAEIVPEAHDPPAPRSLEKDSAPQARPRTEEVRSWHWHVGSKITKRTIVADPALNRPPNSQAAKN
jgi:hypothetical protein